MGSHSKWPSLLSTDFLCSFLSRFQATVIGEEKEWKCAKSPSMVVSPGCEKPALPPFALQADEPRALPRWEEVSGSLRAPRTQGDTVQPSPLAQPALTSHRPRSRSWGAGAGVTGGSVTFLQTGSPARHSRVEPGHSWLPHPMSSHLTWQRGGVSPNLCRPLPCEHAAEGWGPPGPQGHRGSVDWARYVPSEGSCPLGWQIRCLDLGGPPLESLC